MGRFPVLVPRRATRLAVRRRPWCEGQGRIGGTRRRGGNGRRAAGLKTCVYSQCLVWSGAAEAAFLPLSLRAVDSGTAHEFSHLQEAFLQKFNPITI